MANYLVTGAAGFIGGAIAKKLIDSGHNVVTIDNLSTGYEECVPEGVQFFKGDCANAEMYEKIPQHPYAAIFHIAGQSSGEISFSDPIYDIRSNVESTLLLLKFALKNQCDRFIYAGTMSVYGVKPEQPIAESEECCPQSFYGVAKLASEHYMRIYRQYGVNSTSLRLFNVYGPGQNLKNLKQGMISIYLAQMLKNNHIHVMGSAERFRDFIYINDVVEAFVRCLNAKDSYHKSINVAFGDKTSVGTIIEMLQATQSRSVSVKYEGSTEGDIHGIFADISLLKETLGQWNMTPLQDGLKKMVEHYSQ
jgi:UDP-glucose 4-epimerase